MIRVTKGDIVAAANALRSATCICYRGENQHGPFKVTDPECPLCNDEEKQVELILNTVLPRLESRINEEATRDAVTMIAAICQSQGGRIAIPMRAYTDAQGVELVRYDDPTTMSVVFETPIPDVA